MQRPLISSLALVFALSAAASAQVTSIGLSAVRAQRFGNDLAGFDPQPQDNFAWSLAVGDFDGDGAGDLATGVPFDDGVAGSEVPDTGLVAVRYGVAGGGLGPEIQILRQLASGIEEEDFFGFSLASCDFDGDGFDDLAVGTPGEDVDLAMGAGAVSVFYGTASGLAADLPDVFNQDTPGVPDASEDGDEFGSALACADFDADGFDDLAIGAPGEKIGTAFQTGQVFLFAGAAGGLVPGVAFSQEPAGLGAKLGASLAAGDWNGDGFADLAAGAPGVNTASGALEVRFGSAAGIGLARALSLTETDIGGLSEFGDQFARALAAGNFDGDARVDLAIGIPFQDFGAGGSIGDGGQFNVLYGASGGFDLARTQYWAQNNILGAGTSEQSDIFGWAMAAGDFDRDGRDDLAIGALGEFVTGPQDGAATVIMGSPAGLTADRHRSIAAGLGGFPGDATQHARWFSFSLAAGDFDGDGHADLAIGAPLEDENGVADAGTETVLYGAIFADGFESGATDLWSATSP
jgi:hypothetical protein